MRGSLRARGRNWVRTLLHPRRRLSWRVSPSTKLAECGCGWTLAFGSCLAQTPSVLIRGERHGVRLLPLGFSRTAWWRVRLSGLPSHSEVPKQPPVRLGRCTSSYVSLRMPFEGFPFLGLMLALFALGTRCIISFWLRIWQSRFLCLGVACGVQGIGRFCGYSGAVLGSTVDT